MPECPGKAPSQDLLPTGPLSSCSDHEICQEYLKGELTALPTNFASVLEEEGIQRKDQEESTVIGDTQGGLDCVGPRAHPAGA